MDWDNLTEQFCVKNQCSQFELMAVQGNTPSLRTKEKQRAEIYKASAAVQKAYANNPHASRQELRTQAYKFIGGSLLIGLLANLLLSYLTKKAVEWFLDHLFGEAFNGNVSLPAE